MKKASSVIVVPGYGMAVAQAQHALREMADRLKREGVKVPTPSSGGRTHARTHERAARRSECSLLRSVRAGRHHSQFRPGDVAYVIGANERHQSGGKEQYAIADLRHAGARCGEGQTVLFVKRGMGSGYAGIENELVFRDNTMCCSPTPRRLQKNRQVAGISGSSQAKGDFETAGPALMLCRGFRRTT